jgi:hypothetical protein
MIPLLLLLGEGLETSGQVSAGPTPGRMLRKDLDLAKA